MGSSELAGVVVDAARAVAASDSSFRFDMSAIPGAVL
jgi:hypothetical protein